MSCLRVLCGTWNVNGHLPTAESLQPWISPSANSAPHLVAVSLQELVDLKQFNNYVNEEKSRSRIQLWSTTIVRALQLTYRLQFSLIAQEQMVGTAVLVICQSQLLPHIRHVSFSHVATGKFGVMGNKGGCAIRFSFMDQFTFCFVGVHLCAHQENTLKRNLDWENVLSKLSFVSKRHSMESVGSGSVGGELEMRVMDHDLVFAMGDFNYRLDFDSSLQVMELIERRDYNQLLARDQLLNELHIGQGAFEGFTDALPITFPPTFKFQIGTSCTYVEKRVPAWCDRVIFNCNPNLHSISKIKCIEYRSSSSLVVSDHKPVAADFEIHLTPPPIVPGGAKHQDQPVLTPNTSRSRSIVFFPEISQLDSSVFVDDVGRELDEDEVGEGIVVPLHGYTLPMDSGNNTGANLVDYTQSSSGPGMRRTSFEADESLDDYDDDDDDDGHLIVEVSAMLGEYENGEIKPVQHRRRLSDLSIFPRTRINSGDSGGLSPIVPPPHKPTSKKVLSE
ncbi:hypothetical protein BASA81_001555 [Batrachochytrium salamandrivorans]|nr:hypothetical protein BASA81_001555 [Batrachochytrium salamandrivorans]